MNIGDSFRNAIDGIFDVLPHLLGFVVILLVGLLVAKLVAGVVGTLLEKVQIDRRLHESPASEHVNAVLPHASTATGIGRVVFWLVLGFFLTAAIGALGIPAATGFMNQVLAYLPHVIVAILIFVVAALVSGAVAGAVVRFMGDTPTGRVVGTVVPAVVMTIAFFMILEQLQIAPEVIRIAFAAIMVALALGLALAFGLGGRELAAEALRRGQEKSSDAVVRAQQDARAGGDRARSEVQSPDGVGPRGSTAATPSGFDPNGTQQMPPPATGGNGSVR